MSINLCQSVWDSAELDQISPSGLQPCFFCSLMGTTQQSVIMRSFHGRRTGGGCRTGDECNKGGTSVQLADNEVVCTPRHFPPLGMSLSPCACQKVHNRLVIRGRGLRLCTHVVFVA